MIGMATESLVEGYKARFRPTPDGEGYLFFRDNYGEGLPLTREQHAAYVDEFEGFVAGANRFMWRWLFFVLLLLAVVMFVVIWKFDNSFLEQKLDWLPEVGGGIVALPLMFFFWKGYKLRKKPELELANLGPHSTTIASTGRRRASSDILDERILGMSPTGLYVGILLGLVGSGLLIHSLYNGEKPELVYWILPLFILVFGYLLWRRNRILKKDTEVLSGQTEFKQEKARFAWNQLAILATHSASTSKIQQQLATMDLALNTAPGEADEAPYRFFGNMRDALHDIDGMFILYLDWKESISDYFWKIETAIGDTAEIKLPDIGKYPDKIWVTDELVQGDVVSALAEIGLMQVYIEDGSDTHNLLLVRKSDEAQVVELLNHLHMLYSLNYP